MNQRVSPDHDTRAVYDHLSDWHAMLRLALPDMPPDLLRVCVIKLRQASQDSELELLRRNEVLPGRKQRPELDEGERP